MLDQNNSLFNRWTNDQRNRFGRAAPGFLPVIPLMDSVDSEIPQPPWPRNAFQPSSIRGSVERRLGKVAEIAAKGITNTEHGPFSWLIDLLASKAGSMGADKVISIIQKGLQDAQLL